MQTTLCDVVRSPPQKFISNILILIYNQAHVGERKKYSFQELKLHTCRHTEAFSGKYVAIDDALRGEYS